MTLKGEARLVKTKEPGGAGTWVWRIQGSAKGAQRGRHKAIQNDRQRWQVMLIVC